MMRWISLHWTPTRNTQVTDAEIVNIVERGENLVMKFLQFFFMIDHHFTKKKGTKCKSILVKVDTFGELLFDYGFNTSGHRRNAEV